LIRWDGGTSQKRDGMHREERGTSFLVGVNVGQFILKIVERKRWDVRRDENVLILIHAMYNLILPQVFLRYLLYTDYEY